MRHQNNIRSETILLALALTLFPACSLGQAQKDNSVSATSTPSGASGPGTSASEKASSATGVSAGDDAETGGQTTFGPNARGCRLLPIADIENHFGAKLKVTGGLDLDGNSTCSGTINGQAVSIQTAAPGTGGLPTTVSQGLQFAKAMGELSKDGALTIKDTKDFGTVGCYTGTVTGFGKSAHTTTCFQLGGGFLTLTLGSENPDQVSFEVVKGFLEKAAARRKSS